MRRTAVLVGVLFWISNLATVVGSVITGPILNPSLSLARSGAMSVSGAIW